MAPRRTAKRKTEKQVTFKVADASGGKKLTAKERKKAEDELKLIAVTKQKTASKSKTIKKPTKSKVSNSKSPMTKGKVMSSGKVKGTTSIEEEDLLPRMTISERLGRMDGIDVANAIVRGARARLLKEQQDNFLMTQKGKELVSRQKTVGNRTKKLKRDDCDSEDLEKYEKNESCLGVCMGDRLKLLIESSGEWKETVDHLLSMMRKDVCNYKHCEVLYLANIKDIISEKLELIKYLELDNGDKKRSSKPADQEEGIEQLSAEDSIEQALGKHSSQRVKRSSRSYQDSDDLDDIQPVRK